MCVRIHMIEFIRSDVPCAEVHTYVGLKCDLLGEPEDNLKCEDTNNVGSLAGLGEQALEGGKATQTCSRLVRDI